MAETFISFIHEEREYAEAIQKFLAQIIEAGSKPFLSSDKLQVYAGEKWLDRIMDELDEAKVVVLMSSEESVQRPWVNFEAGAAWIRKIPIIPVCFQGLTRDDLPKPYSSLQAVDLTSYGDDEYLAKSVAHYLNVQGPFDRGFQMGIAALGGPESEMKAHREMRACEELQRALKQLDGYSAIRKRRS